MLRMVSVCAALTLLVGCTRYQRTQAIASVGGVVTLAGVAMYADASDVEEAIPVVTYFLLPGLAVLITGVIAMVVVSRQDEADRRRENAARAQAADEAERTAIVATRERAWALTKAARAAQLTRDCPRVVALDSEVRELDPEFHATVFARDVAIQRCLAVATSPAR